MSKIGTNGLKLPIILKAGSIINITRLNQWNPSPFLCDNSKSLIFINRLIRLKPVKMFNRLMFSTDQPSLIFYYWYKVVDWFCAYNCSKESFPISIVGFGITVNELIEINKKTFKSVNIDQNSDLIELISNSLTIDAFEGKFCKEVIMI